MAKEWQKEVLGGCLECLSESEGLFVYVVIPLLCVAIVWIVGMVVCQVLFDPHAASIASTSDCLSINPEKWVSPFVMSAQPNSDRGATWRIHSFDRARLPRFRPIASHWPGSSTSRCASAASTAFSLNGKLNVVPPYHAFH